MRQPLVRVLLEASLQQETNGWRSSCRQSRPVGFLTDDRDDRLGHVLANESALTSKHLVQHAPERPHINAPVDRLALGLFGRHVGGGAENDTLHGDCWRSHRRPVAPVAPVAPDCTHRTCFRKPEVQHLNRAVRSHFDIGGLEIAMDDASLVRSFEGRRQSVARWGKRRPAPSARARDALRGPRPRRAPSRAPTCWTTARGHRSGRCADD